MGGRYWDGGKEREMGWHLSWLARLVLSNEGSEFCRRHGDKGKEAFLLDANSNAEEDHDAEWNYCAKWAVTNI